MEKYNDGEHMDYGAYPFATNIVMEARDNNNYRSALWTGCNLQMTLMSIPVCGEIGLEVHEDTDQYIRVEHGKAMVLIGECKNNPDMRQVMTMGDGVFIPVGYWHNIINIGNCPLKLSSVYAPPHHPWGTVQETNME